MLTSKWRIVLAVSVPIVIVLGAFNFFLFFDKKEVVLTLKEQYHQWREAKPSYDSLKSGDLILRHGRGIISDAFMQLSVKEKKYSHSGLIHKEGGKVYVYHAIGGEDNPDSKLRKDWLTTFCDPRYVHSFAIYRYDLNERKKKILDSLATQLYNKGVLFDLKFDLATDSVMYCSEFVYKSLQKASNQKDYISTNKVNGITYVPIDNLYLNKHCSFIYSHSY